MKARIRTIKNKLRPYVQWTLIVSEAMAFVVALAGLFPFVPILDGDTAFRVAVAIASGGVVLVAIFARWDDDRPLNQTQLGQVQEEAIDKASKLDEESPLNDIQKEEVKRESMVNALLMGD